MLNANTATKVQHGSLNQNLVNGLVQYGAGWALTPWTPPASVKLAVNSLGNRYASVHLIGPIWVLEVPS